MFYYEVAPSRPFMDTLTYESELDIPIGCRVEIPIGKSKGFGFIVEKHKDNPVTFKTKKIIKVSSDSSFFGKGNLKFYKWISDYYHYPLGETLSLIIPSFVPKRKKDYDAVETTSVSLNDPVVNFTGEQKEAQRLILDANTQKKYSSRN